MTPHVPAVAIDVFHIARLRNRALTKGRGISGLVTLEAGSVKSSSKAAGSISCAIGPKLAEPRKGARKIALARATLLG